MILPKVILESQDILVSSSEGPQDGFFSFSSGGYLVGGVTLGQELEVPETIFLSEM